MYLSILVKNTYKIKILYPSVFQCPMVLKFIFSVPTPIMSEKLKQFWFNIFHTVINRQCYSHAITKKICKKCVKNLIWICFLVSDHLNIVNLIAVKKKYNEVYGQASRYSRKIQIQSSWNDPQLLENCTETYFLENLVRNVITCRKQNMIDFFDLEIFRSASDEYIKGEYYNN